MVQAYTAAVRLQLNPQVGFGLPEAARLCRYLADLGVSHLYISPILACSPGSSHGYDPISFTKLCVFRGGESGLAQLAAAAARFNLRIILDTIPNHMGAEGNEYFSGGDYNAVIPALVRASGAPMLVRDVFDICPITGIPRTYWDFGWLLSLNQHDRDVFNATYARTFELIEEGKIHGLRTDHPDGLPFPDQHAEWLVGAGGVPVWYEKADRPGEHIPSCLAGTTGAEFLRDVEALCNDRAGRQLIRHFYGRLTGDTRTFAEVLAEMKLKDANVRFRQHVYRLWRQLAIPEITEDEIANAVSAFDYRLYIDLDRRQVPLDNVEEIKRAGLAGLSERMQRILLLQEAGHDEFIRPFQCLQAEIAGRSEISAKFRYIPLLNLNELGCNPDEGGIDVEEFHRRCELRLALFPLTLNSLENHDSLLSLDARLRLRMLTYRAPEWIQMVRRWIASNQSLRQHPDKPTLKDEYRFYQLLTALGDPDAEQLINFNHPAFQSCFYKQLREGGQPLKEGESRPANQPTDWFNPDQVYEEAAWKFLVGLCQDHGFLAKFKPFLIMVAQEASRLTPGQWLLKLTVPGMADIYQGSELQFFALGDPHNRLPVDWPLREQLLAELKAGARPTATTAKMAVIVASLAVRSRNPESFMGQYRPVSAPAGVIAYRRGPDVEVWVGYHPNSSVPDSKCGWTNRIADVTALGYPVALFERDTF